MDMCKELVNDLNYGSRCMCTGMLNMLCSLLLLRRVYRPSSHADILWLQRLKQVLNNVLGSNRHRVRPRLKGDTSVYLHFITLEDMRIAKETLTTRGVAKYKLTVTVCWCCGGTAGFENLSHVKRNLASKNEVVAVLAVPDVLRLFY